MSGASQKTAFVFAGGGSLGAVQVGMLRELMRHRTRPLMLNNPLTGEPDTSDTWTQGYGR